MSSSALVISSLLIFFLVLASAALALNCRRQTRSARNNRAQLLELTDTLPLGIACIAPLHGRYQYVNPSYAALFDRRPGQLQNHLLEESHETDFATMLGARCAAVPAGGSTTFEHELLSADGTPGRRVRIVLAQFQREEVHGAPLVTAVVSDISASAQAAEQLQRQLAELSHVTRLATMGELAAKLAHELNQPLCAISGYTRASLRMMRSGQWNSEELIEALEDASQQAERAADIIRGLRNFLRKSPVARSAVYIITLVDEVVPLVRLEAQRRQVEIDVHHDAELPAVLADRVELEQVLFNLLLNGIESIGSDGTWPRRVTVTALAIPSGVEISVADSGSGFVEGVTEHLFDPFFSTKQDGMGMGLAICRTIVEAHDGELRARNNPEGGATFTFRLPLQPGQQTDAA